MLNNNDDRKKTISIFLRYETRIIYCSLCLPRTNIYYRDEDFHIYLVALHLRYFRFSTMYVTVKFPQKMVDYPTMISVFNKNVEMTFDTLLQSNKTHVWRVHCIAEKLFSYAMGVTLLFPPRQCIWKMLFSSFSCKYQLYLTNLQTRLKVSLLAMFLFAIL